MLAESSDTLTLWEGLSLLAIDPVTSSGMFIEGLTLELSGGAAVRLNEWLGMVPRKEADLQTPHDVPRNNARQKAGQRSEA